MTGHEPYRNLKFAGIIVGIFHSLLSFHIAVFIVGMFIYERMISGKFWMLRKITGLDLGLKGVEEA